MKITLLRHFDPLLGPWTFALDYAMALDASDASDSRRTSDRCKTRMSSLLHDRHSICNVCRGFVCSLEKCCVECESWSDDCMNKYLKHMRSLESKSKSSKAKKPMDVSDQGSHPAFGVSSVKSTESASASSGISEARVVEIVNSQFSEFRSSFTASMETSFANIQAFIEDRLGSNISQDVHDSNRSFPAPLPAPFDQAPIQSQTNPSVRNPCIGWGRNTGAGAG